MQFQTAKTAETCIERNQLPDRSDGESGKIGISDKFSARKLLLKQIRKQRIDHGGLGNKVDTLILKEPVNQTPSLRGGYYVVSHHTAIGQQTDQRKLSKPA